MNILLAVDDSPHSKATAHFLERFRFPQRSKLFILTIVEPNPLTSNRRRGEDQLSVTYDHRKKNAWDFVNTMAEKYWKPEVKLIPIVEIGIPGAKILDTIERHKIDLTVVGTHGLTGRQRFLLGSVSEWVLTEAPCSVLLVRKPSVKKVATSTSGLKILIGVDGSTDAKAAVNYICRLKLPVSTKVTVCSILSEQNPLTKELSACIDRLGVSKSRNFESEVRKAQNQSADKALDECVHKLSNSGINAQRKLLYGHPADQLLNLAEQKKYDLIVVGSRGLTGLRKVFLGSVSNKVACHAPCSVLVIRNPKQVEQAQRHPISQVG